MQTKNIIGISFIVLFLLITVYLLFLTDEDGNLYYSRNTSIVEQVFYLYCYDKNYEDWGFTKIDVENTTVKDKEKACRVYCEKNYEMNMTAIQYLSEEEMFMPEFYCICKPISLMRKFHCEDHIEDFYER